MFPLEEIIKIAVITLSSFICTVGWGFFLKKKGKLNGFNTKKNLLFCAFRCVGNAHRADTNASLRILYA